MRADPALEECERWTKKNPGIITASQGPIGRGLNRGLLSEYSRHELAMQQFLSQEIHLVLSRERLESYQRDGASDQIAVARYCWNVALAEALYPSLHVVEIALRNALDAALARYTGDSGWLQAQVDFLDERGRGSVSLARAKLGPRESHGKLVAELTFGFWTSLLNKAYEQSLWVEALHEAFPGLRPSQRTRRTVSSRMNKIRDLRNRVFHHEPIWYRQTLAVDHADLLGAIEWLSPFASALAQELDRFPVVYAQRP